MEEHAKGYNEMNELYEKLSNFRKNTAECAEKLLADLTEDKWIEKTLLTSLSEAADQMEGLQDSFLNSLVVHKIPVGATLTQANEAVTEWDKRELAKSIANEIGQVLKKVCALTYVGEQIEIKEDLANIQREAASLLVDLEHFERHQERIDAMKKLVAWVESGKPLTFAEEALCNKVFGFNLCYAVREKQLRLGEESVAIPSEEKAQVVKEETISAHKKEWDIPESEFYDGSLIVECNPVKPKLKKSATSFGNGLKNAARGFFSSVCNVLDMLQLNMVLVADIVKENCCKNQKARDIFECALEMVYDLGLAKKITWSGRAAYTLNREILPIYRTDSIKKMISKMIFPRVSVNPVMLQYEGEIPDVWYIRNFMQMVLHNRLQKKYVDMPSLNDERDGNPIVMCKVPAVKDEYMNVGILAPIFTKENLDEEVRQVEERLKESEEKETHLFVIAQNAADREYWSEKLKDYKISKVVMCSLEEDDDEPVSVNSDDVQPESDTLKETDSKTPGKTEKDDDEPVAQVKKEAPMEAKEKGEAKEAIEEESKELLGPRSEKEPVKDAVSAPEEVPVEAKEEEEIKEAVEEESEESLDTLSEKEPLEAVISAPEEASMEAKEEEEIKEAVKEESKEVLDTLSASAKESVEEMISAIAGEIHKHHIAEGMLMLHGLDQREKTDWPHRLLSEISYVLGDPLYPKLVPKEDAYTYWNYTIDVPGMEEGKARDYLNAAAMIRYFFKPSYNAGNWHWQSEQTWKQIRDDSSNSALLDVPEIKEVISFFQTFLSQNKKGLGWCMGGESQIQEKHDEDLAFYTNEVQNMEKRLEQKKTKNFNHTRVTETYKKICDASDLSLFLSSPKDFTAEEILNYCNRFAEKMISEKDILDDEELTFVPSDTKIENFMDETWNSIKVDRKQTDGLKGTARGGLKAFLNNAFGVLGNYVFARIRVERKSKMTIEISTVKKAMEEAAKLCTDLIGCLKDKTSKNPLEEISLCSLRYLVKDLLKSFNANYHQPMEFYEPFLLTNYVELTERYLPMVDFNYGLPELDLYNRVKKHVEVIETNNLTPEEKCYEMVIASALEAMNMGTYKLLCRKMGIDRQDVKEEDIKTRGDDYLEKYMEDFRSELELAYNYGRLTQKDEIESYENLAEALVSHLKEIQNFGVFELFVDACKARIDENSKPRQKELEEQFVSLCDMLKNRISGTSETLQDYPILDDIKKCLDSRNFSVAEDYMRQCQDGNLNEIKNPLGNGTDEFNRFMEAYQNDYVVCSKNNSVNLDKTLDTWLLNRGKNRSSTSRNSIGKGQIQFVREWDRLLSSTGKITPEAFLEMLGYPKVLSQNIKKEKQTNNRMSYTINFGREHIHRSKHPFKQFGSGIYDAGLQIVTFTGAHSPDTIISELQNAGIERNRGTICLLDASMAWADRRKLAMLMKSNEFMYNVIVIDRVMALYLAQFAKPDREDIMMKLCMPFANATPFQHKGFIPPEMFIGRTRELADIRNMDGPNLVYGGRQLGKSILLRQVSFLDNQPEQERYAFYFDVKDMDDALVLKEISQKLKKEKLLTEPLSDWEDFASAMDIIMEKAKQLILLIDEADAFILASNKIKDRPIEVLRMTQNNFQGHFKFVLAGLHNVIRYDKSALSSNTVYGQLGHINIKPFKYKDACDLLLGPLSYLGFTVENPEIVSTILAKTNYFPGLIQYYGLKLLESVKTAYAKHYFNPNTNPPYVLNEAYLKQLMEDDSFLKEIEEKFMITLRVDQKDDNLYYLLTLGIAYLYAADDKPVTLEKIKEILSGIRIGALSDDKLSALLEELEELNVLRKRNHSEYIFNRYSFYSMLGGSDKIEKELSEYATN